MILMEMWIFLVVGTMQACSNSVDSDVVTDLCPCTVNMSAIEELIDEKLSAALRSSRNSSYQIPTSDQTPCPRSVTPQQKTYSSCHDVAMESAKSQNETGGVFEIVIPDVGVKEVYCDTMTDGGNWIVFQRRMDGSVDFNRFWYDYVNGFGNPSKEHWLGLELIHQLTKVGDIELRIDMIALDGTYYYAKYSSFKVGPAADKFRLRVSGYSGNATDSIENTSNSHGDLHNQQFSTRDNDNDQSRGNCAVTYNSGWWFNYCHWSNLNGPFNRGLYWRNNRIYRKIKMRFAEMKFRRK